MLADVRIGADVLGADASVVTLRGGQAAPVDGRELADRVGAGAYVSCAGVAVIAVLVR